ncbi:hypothetical protein [Pelagicoccus mobilis]|nr:hypothetical protein [Pelagicoccus mobilis]
MAGKKGNTDFVEMYLLGDKGPVQRLKAEADQLSEEEKAKPKRKK